MNNYYLIVVVLAVGVFLYQLRHRNFLMALLILGLITFFDTFAKLNLKIGGVPIYATEAVIFLTILTLVITGLIKGKFVFPKIPLKISFFIWYFIFLISLIKGLLLYEDKFFVLRQSALFYYSIFYFLIPLAFYSQKRINSLLKIFFIVYLILPWLMLANVGPEKLGFFAYFYCPIFIIFEFFYLQFISPKKRWLIYLAITGQTIIFIIAQARASWVGAIIAGIFGFYLVYIRRLGTRLFVKIIRSLCLMSIILFFAGVVFKPQIVEKVAEEAGTILFLAPKDSTGSQASIMTARWRLYVWKDIVNETLEKPILGWGFGKKFIPPTIKALGWGGSWHDPEKGFQDPHNSFLSIFHHTGIVGLTIFIFIILGFFNHFLSFSRIVKDEKIKVLIIASLVSIVYILGTSFFMVVLEGPYLGISLWFLMGLCVSLENIYRKSLVRQNENS